MLGIAFTGSRTIQLDQIQSKTYSILELIAQKNGTIFVGCAIGLDAIILQTAINLQIKTELFLAFGPNFIGSWAGSNIQGVKTALNQSTVTPHWWAGGSKEIPLVNRLSRRSISMVQAIYQSDYQSDTQFVKKGIIGFIDHSPCRGTYRTLSRAYDLQLPILVYPINQVSLRNLTNTTTWEAVATLPSQDLWKGFYKTISI